MSPLAFGVVNYGRYDCRGSQILMSVFWRSIDVELPIVCDDEYWINPDPNLAFKQPEGKPSTVAYFNCALRLAQIHAFALRTIVRACPVRSVQCAGLTG